MPLGPVITSRSNARVKALREAFSGVARKPGELVGIEGATLIAEALSSGLVLDTVFLREGREALFDTFALPSANAVVLSSEVFASAVDTASPQGVVATFAIPVNRPRSPPASGAPILVLESLQDPGNLGTLLRSAEAFGVPFVILTPDGVNPWNPKVIRASAGSVFRVPVVRTPLSGLREALGPAGTHLFAAVVHRPDAVSLLEADLTGPCAVMIGNEGSGLSAEALALADAMVTIPCAVESLNAAVAGAILLYEAMRQTHLSSLISHLSV
jgi:TrmH family RNA methyltransferase